MEDREKYYRGPNYRVRDEQVKKAIANAKAATEKGKQWDPLLKTGRKSQSVPTPQQVREQRIESENTDPNFIQLARKMVQALSYVEGVSLYSEKTEWHGWLPVSELSLEEIDGSNS